MDRSGNARRNMVYGTINKVICLLLPFIVRTVIIRTLGAEYSGLSSLFSSILQVLNLAELGFSSAIVYSMYKPVAENDTDTICALLRLYKKIYRIIGIFILAAGLIITPFLDYIISGDAPSDINIKIVFVVYLLNTSISYLLFGYKSSIPNALQRVDVINKAYTITQVLMSVGQLAVLFAFKNYYAYVILMPITTFLNNLIVSRYVDKNYPQYVCKGEVPSHIMKKMKVKVVGLMINKVCQTTRNSFDSICTSAFLGLVYTTMYSNYFYIITALNTLFSVFSSSVTAGIGNSIVLDGPEKNYKDMKRINFIYMWIGGWSSITLMNLYQPFMELWVGEDLLLPFNAVLLFTLYFYVLKMGDVRSIYSDASGLWWENRYRAIIESVANVVLNIVLAKTLGVQGIILATLISLFIINFGLGSQIIFNHYFKNGKIWEYFGNHLRYFAVTVLIGIPTYILCSYINGSPLLVLALRGLVCVVFSNVLYYLIYFKTKEFREAVQWLIPRIKKK